VAEAVLEQHDNAPIHDVDDVLAAEAWARTAADRVVAAQC
jgi:hypothetical protein